jgi:predicted GNAT family acetyltransferase
MNNVKYVPSDKDTFVIEENDERIAEMIVSISGNEMSVYHTEVLKKLEGQGIGTKLIEAMTAHARANQLRVIPYCPFVKAQFRENEERYADIWEKDHQRT